MKKSIFNAVIASALLLTVGLPTAFATHSSPLRGNMSGSGTAISQTTNQITATGHLSHLGNIGLVGTTMVTGFSDCHGFVGTEVDTITASNGDQIFDKGNGTSCPGSNQNVFDDIVTFTVTGGTGRFAHASGSGTIHTTITLTSTTSSTFTATIDGTISY